MAKHRMNIAIDDPDAVREQLRAVFIRGMAEDVELMTRRPTFCRADYVHEPRVSVSALARLAFRYAAETSATTRALPALPQRAGSADADRLRAAMGALTPIEVCRAAGLKDSASIRNVTNKGAALAGKLLLWVEQREAEVGT